MNKLRVCYLLIGYWVMFSVGQASAASFVIPEDGSDVIGANQTVTAHADDTLLDIARRYGLGYEDIRQANPDVDIWLPGAGTPVLLPTQFILPNTPRNGIVINVPEMRLYYYVPSENGDAEIVQTFPISIGRRDWSTPLGLSKVVNKTKNPAWYPPLSIRNEHAEQGRTLAVKVDPGADNPLGQYALGLDLPGYLIHGTNRPYGIGLRVTHGCLRLYPEDIETLFNTVPVGTSVRIVNQPYKAGWRNGTLYFETHKPLAESSDRAERNHTAAISTIITADDKNSSNIVWERVRNTIARSSGLPVPISSGLLATEKIAAASN